MTKSKKQQRMQSPHNTKRNTVEGTRAPSEKSDDNIDQKQTQAKT